MIVQEIRKSYKQKVILNGVGFEANPGQCIGIIGSNGSGKSTLLSILAGVLKADHGRFLCDGVDLLADHKKRSELVGYVPQSTPLLEELNAWDNLSLWYQTEELKRELEQGVLALLGISEFLKTPVYKMSGGMKKRLAIGCAVAHHPRILLLDEPAAALDLVCKQNIAEYLLKFKTGGGTIFLATHDVQELSLCDRLYLLKNNVLSPYEYDGDVQALVRSL